MTPKTHTIPMYAFPPRLRAMDARVVRFLRARSPDVVRIALGIVFVWFGALKIVGASPVEALVAAVLPGPPALVVPLLGAFEVVVGTLLLARRALRLVLALFALQMIGTFAVLVLRPDLAFQGGNPLLLTTEGEFVVKNLVLLAAGLVVGGTVRPVPRTYENA